MSVTLKKSLLVVLSLFMLALLWQPTQAATLVEYDHKTDPALDLALDEAGPLDLHEVIITLSDMGVADQIASLAGQFIAMQELPMVGAVLTTAQIEQVVAWPEVVYMTYNSPLQYFLAESVPFIGADQVWTQYGQLGANVAVAVIDSGIDATHPDLLYGYKTIQNVKMTPFGIGVENVVNTDNSSGHGTHVAGTIGGLGTLSDGHYRGVAPDVKLVGLGAGEAIAILTAVQSYDWVLAHHDAYNIRVISNSWGSSGGDFDPNNAINVATYAAYQRGLLSVFAAGNDGGYNILNPYSLAPWVLSVAAGTKDGDLAGFSSRGKAGDFYKHPDLTAPGVDIYAARCSCIGITALDPNINPVNPAWTAHYTTMDGTSMATPHVSGAAALLLSADPSLSPDQVIHLLTETTTPMPDYELHEVGTGYLNALAAYEAAQSVTGNLDAFLAGDQEFTLDLLLGFDPDTMAYHTVAYTGYTAVGATTMPANTYPIEVTDDVAYLDLKLTWDPAVEDAYDLELVDADGTVVASSGNSVGESESVLYVPETAGTYTLRVVPFAAAGTTYTATVTRAFGEELANWPPELPAPYDFYLNVTNLYKTVGVVGLAAEYLRGGDSAFIVFTFNPADGSAGTGYAADLQAIYRDRSGAIVRVDDAVTARSTAGEYQTTVALDDTWTGLPGPVTVNFAYLGAGTVDAAELLFYVNHMDVTLATDATDYDPGDTVTFDGTVAQLTTVGTGTTATTPTGANVTVSLIDGDGATLAQTVATVDSDGQYSGAVLAPASTRGAVRVVAEATYSDPTIVTGPADWFGSAESTILFPGNLAPVVDLHASGGTDKHGRALVHLHASVSDPDGLDDIDAITVTVADADGRTIRRWRESQFTPIGDEMLLTRSSKLTGVGPWTVTLTATDSAGNSLTASQLVTPTE